MPTRFVRRKTDGRLCQRPLIPSLLFVRATRQEIDTILLTRPDIYARARYLRDKARPFAPDGKHHPLVVPDAQMESFALICGSQDEHIYFCSVDDAPKVRLGAEVEVIAGPFAGVRGRVCRLAGQKRVVVEMAGLGLVGTAFVKGEWVREV